MQKKIETSCLYPIVTLLQNTRTMPSKVMKGVLVMILVTLGCIPSDEVSCNFFMSLIPYWVSKQNASIFSLYNLFLLSNITHFRKKSCIPSSYFISLPSVVGQRRLSGYYNKICSICIINLPSVNSLGSILQYFLPVSLTYGFFIGFDEILKESLCSISFIFPISQYIIKSSTWHWI